MYGSDGKKGAGGAADLEDSKKTASKIMIFVLAGVGGLFLIAVLWYLTLDRDRCLEQLRMVFMLRYDAFSGERYFDYYSGAKVENVADTFPSYWKIARAQSRDLADQHLPVHLREQSKGSGFHGRRLFSRKDTVHL